MSYVRNCDSDVFISYAHFDDEPMFEGQRGWVEVFHQALEVRLRQLLGETANIWRDPALPGNEYFDDSLTQRLVKTALLLSVVTPRYLRSASCLKEVETFCRGAEESGGLRFQDKARLLKVVKTEVALGDLPPPLQPLLGYEFYALDQAKRPREFRLPPAAGDESYQACLDTLEDLAYDIKMTLEALRAIAAQDVAVPAGTPARTAYIAETISSLRPQADQLRRELRQRGFIVFPCEAAPENGAQYREFVARQLETASVSVHLLGALYGTTPEGDTASTVEIQIELAGLAAQKGTLHRVLWFPEMLPATEERQQRFIDTLQQGAANEANTELMRTGIENLKTYVLRKLAEPQKPPVALKTPGTAAIVYLIHDQRDTERVETLRDLLMARGYEVKPSYFEGDEKELREYHQQSLVECDGTIIYYGAANELWVQRKLYDLRKAFGFGRQRPFLGKAVLVGVPATPEKGRFRTQDALVITLEEAFSAAALEPFMGLLAAHP